MSCYGMLWDEIPMLCYQIICLGMRFQCYDIQMLYYDIPVISFAMDYVVSYMLELKVNEGECTQDFNLSLYSFSKVSLKV